MSRPRRTFEDRFEELLAEATYEQLKYMADFSAAQVRLADRRLGSSVARALPSGAAASVASSNGVDPKQPLFDGAKFESEGKER